MAVAYVRYNTPSGTPSFSFGTSATAGNQVYVMAFTDQSASATFAMNGATSTISNVPCSGSATFTDGHGDTYSLWADLAIAAAENITISQPAGLNVLNTIEIEFSGALSTLSAFYNVTANPAGGTVSGQAVTPVTGDLLVAVCYNADAFGNFPTVNTAGSTSIQSFNDLCAVYWSGAGSSITPVFNSAAGDATTPHVVIQWIVSASSSNTNSATIAWLT